MLHRISRRGPGQMPPIMSNVVDEAAVELLREWIAAMEPSRAFVKSWKTSDLVARIDEYQQGSTEKGALLYSELGCLQCHRRNDKGGGAGPDLSRLASQRKPTEVLQSLLDPSSQIAVEFASTMIVTHDGDAIEGRVEFEDEKQVVLRLANTQGEPVVVAKEAIELREPSMKSTMPDGLLNTCTESEILDLLAFLLTPVEE